MIESWHKLICDHCGHKTAASKGAGKLERSKSLRYTPDSPLWAKGVDGEDVCWYCINNGVPWVHVKTGIVYNGPFARTEFQLRVQ